MHIVINSRSFLRSKYTGIGRYALNLVRQLIAIDTENKYTLYARKGLFDSKKRVPRFKVANLKVKKDYLGLGPEGTVGKMDIFHAPAPEMLPVKKPRLIVTIHDLVYKAYPEAHTEEACLQSDAQMKSLIGHTEKFICCSQSTRNDLKKYFGVSDDKSCVVYQGVDHNLFYPAGDNEIQDAVARLKSLGIKSDFILFVGTIEPRKNLENVLRAFADLVKREVFSGQLAIAGMMGWKSENLDSLLIELGINRHIVFLGYVQDFELRYLYNCCEAFLFPSMYEGFGFPILEAMCCGAPVVTSNISSCPEVGGDAAVAVNPRSYEEISSAVEDVLINDDLRENMVQKGFKQAEKFSFRKNAEETLKVYHEVMEGK